MNSLIYEPAYLPIGGMNPDGNGISIQPTEAVWLDNLRVTPAGATQREGLRSTQTLWRHPPMHALHYFKGVNITSPKAFGFCQKMIVEFLPGEHPDWIPSGVRNFYASGPCSATGGDFYAPAIGMHTTHERKRWTQATFVKEPLHFSPVAGDTIYFICNLPSLEVEYSSGDNGVLAGVPAEAGLFHYWIVVPSGKTIDYIVNPTATPSVSFYGCWELKYSFDCKFFSLAEALDFNALRLVVAGSNPSLSAIADSDEGQRVLLQYSEASGWETKVLWEQFSVGREDTGKIGAAAGVDVPDATIPNEMTAGDEIIPGSFFLFTLQDGEIARSSSILVGGKYKLFSNGGYVDEANSWVEEDGTWNIRYTAEGVTKFSTRGIYIAYSFKTPVDYKPRYVASFQGRLLLGSTVEDSIYFTWRLRHSYAGDSSLFNENDFFDILSYGVETLEKIQALGSSLFIYTQQGLHRGFFENNILIIRPFWQGGTISGRTVASFNNLHFFLGTDDIYVFDGSTVTSSSFSQGQDRVKKTIFDLFDKSKAIRSFGFFNERSREYWLFIPDASTDYPTRCFVYSIDRNHWTHFTFAETLASGYFVLETDLTWDGFEEILWDEIVETWDELGGSSFDKSYLLSFAETTPFLSPSVSTELTTRVALPMATSVSDTGYSDSAGGHYEVVFNESTPVPWYLISRDFIYNSLERKDRTLMVDFEAIGDSITFAINGDFSADQISFEQEQVIPLNDSFDKRAYFPDFYDYAARLLLKGTGFINLRWLQAKAKVFIHKGEV